MGTKNPKRSKKTSKGSKKTTKRSKRSKKTTKRKTKSMETNSSEEIRDLIFQDTPSLDTSGLIPQYYPNEHTYHVGQNMAPQNMMTHIEMAQKKGTKGKRNLSKNKKTKNPKRSKKTSKRSKKTTKRSKRSKKTTK